MVDFTDIKITDRTIIGVDTGVELEALPPDAVAQVAAALKRRIDRQIAEVFGLPSDLVRPYSSAKPVGCPECGGMILHRSGCRHMAT